MPVRRTQSWLPSIFNDFFDNDWMVKANATAPAIPLCTLFLFPKHLLQMLLHLQLMFWKQKKSTKWNWLLLV